MIQRILPKKNHIESLFSYSDNSDTEEMRMYIRRHLNPNHGAVVMDMQARAVLENLESFQRGGTRKAVFQQSSSTLAPKEAEEHEDSDSTNSIEKEIVDDDHPMVTSRKMSTFATSSTSWKPPSESQRKVSTFGLATLSEHQELLTPSSMVQSLNGTSLRRASMAHPSSHFAPPANNPDTFLNRRISVAPQNQSLFSHMNSNTSSNLQPRRASTLLHVTLRMCILNHLNDIAPRL